MEHLTSRQRSVILRRSEVLEELSASERSAALAIIRQRDKNGRLDYLWTAHFLTVLTKLKAQERDDEFVGGGDWSIRTVEQ
ncbi:MAG: hypothetical protein ACYTDW_20390 [Planctomycetota bacterium]|jgi:hypothetical protein